MDKVLKNVALALAGGALIAVIGLGIYEILCLTLLQVLAYGGLMAIGFALAWSLGDQTKADLLAAALNLRLNLRWALGGHAAADATMRKEAAESPDLNDYEQDLREQAERHEAEKKADSMDPPFGFRPNNH